MDSEQALNISMSLNPKESNFEQLRDAKGLFEMHSTSKLFSLADQDINFIEIVEKLNLSSREKDILFIAHSYHECFYDYNVEVLIKNEKLSTRSIEKLNRMYKVLKNYKLLHLLFSNSKIISLEEFNSILESS